MRLSDTFLNFLSDIRAQKLRTTLTLLGITWGTVAVIVLLAFGVGLERQTMKNMTGMGDGIVVLFNGRTTIPHEGFPSGRSVRMREGDAVLLKQQVSGISAISPEFIRTNIPARRDTAVTNPATTGIYPVYAEMRNIAPQPGGRFINTLDMEMRRRVAFLGDELKNQLFGEGEALGEEIFVGRIPFRVIGVMEPKVQSSSYHARDQDRLFIPSTTFQALYGDVYVNNIVYKPADSDDSKTIESQVYQLLGKKYRFDPSDRSAIGVWDTSDMNEMLGYFFLGFKIFMGIVGSFTLIVGGIGVANIMYVVVKERTREIGIRRSVGARKRNIMFQFFLESSALVAFGAILGFLISLLLVRVVALLPIEEFVGTPIVSLPVAVTTVSILAVIAFFSGLFPARKAANLDPVECLRY